MITFGSLFSGIGGIDLGLERCGFSCRWQVEINPFCLQVLEKHWPRVQRHTDIKQLNHEALEWVDVLAGGFPCQDLSSAGKREGIDGARSGLWADFYRCILALRPRAVLVENVNGLLVQGIGRVLRDLAFGGYDAEWDSLSAHAVGAPHIRDRVFISAYLRDSSKNSKSAFTVNDSQAPRVREPGGVSNSIGNKLRKFGEREGEQHKKQGAAFIGDNGAENWWQTQPPVCGVVNGVSRRMDRLRGLGNAVVPQCAEVIGRRMAARLEGSK